MNKQVCLHLSLSLAIATIAGCSSVTSVRDSVDDGQQDGLIYYLPKKELLIKLASAEGTRTVTIEPTAAFADIDERFVAKFRRSQVHLNKLVVVTDAGGLLSGKATTSSSPQLTDILSAVASDVGMLGARSAVVTLKQPDVVKCKGEYSWLLDAASAAPVAGPKTCGLAVTVTRLGSPGTDRKSTYRQQSGFYYRRPMTYLVTVVDNEIVPPRTTSRTVSVPTSDSPTEFLPVPNGLFAKNEGEFTFQDGMPTIYSQELDSEWLGLAKLPASVVKAYFEAVTAGFKLRKDAMTGESQYLSEINKLAIQQEKTRLCLLAVRADDSDLVTAACQ